MVLEGKQRGLIGVLKEVNTEEGYGVVGVEGKDIQVPFNLFSRFDRE